MNRFHQPTDEKRMVVILPETAYSDWLNVPAQDSMDFMRAYPAEAPVAETAPLAQAAVKGAQRMPRARPVNEDAQGALL